MNPQSRIEEAHGLWELAAIRALAMAETKASYLLIEIAIKEERAAYHHWREVSAKCLAESEKRAR